MEEVLPAGWVKNVSKSTGEWYVKSVNSFLFFYSRLSFAASPCLGLSSHLSLEVPNYFIVVIMPLSDIGARKSLLIITIHFYLIRQSTTWFHETLNFMRNEISYLFPLVTIWSTIYYLLPGKPYYFNEATKESRWEPPSGTVSVKREEVRASHILAKSRESRRPSSWREANITRSKEEALAIIQGTFYCVTLHFNRFLYIIRIYIYSRILYGY